MSFLTVNGITLGVKSGSLRIEYEEIGERGRAQDGTAYSSIQTRKRVWSFTTEPMVQATATAWTGLLNGDGVNFDFESDTYSLQGHAATLGGTAARSTARYKYGAASLRIPGSSSAAWTIGYTGDWTIAAWLALEDESYLWSHNVLRSSGASTYWGISGGVLTFGAYSDPLLEYYADDIVAFPFIIPTSWDAQMSAHGAQLPALPLLAIDGDMIQGSSAVNCIGRVSGHNPVEAIIGGSFASNAVELEVELQEA